MIFRKHSKRRRALVATSLAALCLLGCADGGRQDQIDPVVLERLRSSDLSAAAEAFLAASRTLARSQRAEDRETAVAALEQTLSKHPVEMIAMLESHFGGATALRRYAQAMLGSSRGQALGSQLALALRGGDPTASIGTVLSAATQRDGSAWHGVAEDAGFFAGAVACALERHANPAAAATDLAAGLRQPPPDPQGRVDWSEWLRAAALAPERDTGAKVSAAALRTFNLAFERMTQGQ